MSQTKTQRKEVYVGRRKVSHQNFSKIIALPKTALITLGDPSHFDIFLTHEGDLTYLRLVPIRKEQSEA